MAFKMTKEIKKYIGEIDGILKENDPQTRWDQLGGEMLVRISFYQHERLIHLIVTVLFALMTLISFAAAFSVILFLPLAGLFLVLEIPYIFHYYFLENYTQKLYRLYYEVLRRADTK